MRNAWNFNYRIFEISIKVMRTLNVSLYYSEIAAGYERRPVISKHPRFSVARFFLRSYLWAESEFTLDRAKEKCHGWGRMMNKRERKVPGRNHGTISPEGTSCAVCPLHTNAFPIAVHRSHQGYHRERKTGLPILKAVCEWCTTSARI